MDLYLAFGARKRSAEPKSGWLGQPFRVRADVLSYLILFKFTPYVLEP